MAISVNELIGLTLKRLSRQTEEYNCKFLLIIQTDNQILLLCSSIISMSAFIYVYPSNNYRAKAEKHNSWSMDLCAETFSGVKRLFYRVRFLVGLSGQHHLF